MTTERKNVVVIGLGFAGISAVRSLEKVLPQTHRIVVIVESDAGQSTSSQRVPTIAADLSNYAVYNAPVSVRASIVPGKSSPPGPTLGVQR